MTEIATCPICEKEANLGSSNTYRPFCSKRCRLIDLGQWINESYSIAEKRDEDNTDFDTRQEH